MPFCHNRGGNWGGAVINRKEWGKVGPQQDRMGKWMQKPGKCVSAKAYVKLVSLYKIVSPK